MSLAQSTASSAGELEPYREMLEEAVAASPDDPLRFYASVALGLVQVRLGRFEAALRAVREVSSANAGQQRHHLCFIRALSHRESGDHAAAAAATAELRALVAGDFAADPTVYAYVREIELGAR